MAPPCVTHPPGAAALRCPTAPAQAPPRAAPRARRGPRAPPALGGGSPAGPRARSSRSRRLDSGAAPGPTASVPAAFAAGGWRLGRRRRAAPGRLARRGEAPGAAAAARVIDGKAIAAEVRGELAARVRALGAERGITPGLAVVLVGNRPDSAAYVRNKTRAAGEVGIRVFDFAFPEHVGQEELLQCVRGLNGDPAVHGVLVQLPLPEALDERAVIEAIDVRKDVDGLSAQSLGGLARPASAGAPDVVACTPAGCLELLRRSGVDLAGKECVVLGRSGIVGLPMALLLLREDATVRVCHSRTADVARACREADVVVAAVGRPGFVQGDWLKPGCVVIDVGINRVDDATAKRGYRLVGDVDFNAALERAALITPVPGGVGPMTVAMLLRNTVDLAERTAA